MKYGLIGEKLGHSFSKEIHEQLGYEYTLCELSPNQLDEFMRGRDFLGINVTIPYKERVIPYLDVIDKPAREIGAINAVVNRDGKLYGYNTDYFGLRALIERAGIDVRGKKAAILGSGGTSKTALVVLKSLGAAQIIKVSRNGNDGAITYGELYERHSNVAVIVNTTPVGMYPNLFECPVDLSKLNSLIGVVDVVYNPLNTTLVNNARARGIKAESGLYMLVAQAVRASEEFMGKSNMASEAFIDGIYNKIRGQKENIVLVGMPACGKSTVGKILADRLCRPFVDTDELITEKIGMSIKDYFELEGEAAFRAVESDVISSLAHRSNLVIATGGGAILKEENVSALKYNGKLYFIDRPVEILMPTESRPLSSSAEAIKKRYDERYPIYCSVCDVKIDAACDADEVADRILENF